VNNTYTASSGSNGVYEIDVIIPAIYTMKVTHSAYITNSFEVEIKMVPDSYNMGLYPVDPGPPPVYVTLQGDKNICNVPCTVIFTASASGGVAPYTYTIDFRDGSPTEKITSSGSVTFTHTYNDAGGYNVWVIAVPSNSPSGASAFDYVQIDNPSPLSWLWDIFTLKWL
jgi:hypothetical protein